ncbi:hypothetical protein ACU4GR_31650 [Methylobacterium oryzae CBMB20]
MIERPAADVDPRDAADPGDLQVGEPVEDRAGTQVQGRGHSQERVDAALDLSGVGPGHQHEDVVRPQEADHRDGEVEILLQLVVARGCVGAGIDARRR